MLSVKHGMNVYHMLCIEIVITRTSGRGLGTFKLSNALP
jgi:hypothetical protein